MSPQFFPVDYDPWANPEDTASAGYTGMKKLAGAAWHTVIDPWTRPLSDPYKGAILPFSINEKGDLSFDPDAGILGSIKSGATLPYDVQHGLDPMSSEGFARAQDMSNLLAGGPVVGGGGAKASMGLGASGKEMLAALKNFGKEKGVSYDPNLSFGDLIKHAMEVSGGDLNLAKDYIANKSDFMPLTSEQASTHGNAYALLANHQEGIDMQHLVPNVSLGEAGNKTTYHPDMSAEDLAQHAMAVSQNNVEKAKDFINSKWEKVAAGSKAENNHYVAYTMVGYMGKNETTPSVVTENSMSPYHPSMNETQLYEHALKQTGGDLNAAQDYIYNKLAEPLTSKENDIHWYVHNKLANKAAETKPGALPSTPHLSWTMGEEPKDLLAYDWMTPHGLTSDEDPAHVAGMVLAASGGNVDKAKALLKDNPFQYSSFFDPSKDTLANAAKHLDNPYFSEEYHTPVPLNAEAAQHYNTFTDLPAYQSDKGKNLANETFHQWLTNKEEYPSKLGSGTSVSDPFKDLQSVTHPSVPAEGEDWSDLKAEMHKLLGTPEHAIPLTESILPSSGHLDWTVGKTPHDLIQNHSWVSPYGENDMPLTALSAFSGDKTKAINYVKAMLKDNSILSLIWSEKELTDMINNFSPEKSYLPLPLAPEHQAAFDEAVKSGIPRKDAQKDVHEYLTLGFNYPTSFTHDYKKFHFPKANLFKDFESGTPTPKPSFTRPTAPPPPLAPLSVVGRYGPFLPEPPAVFSPLVGKNSYSNALQPFDWQSATSPLLQGNGNVRGLGHIIRGIGNLTDDDLQRIAEQGYNPNLPIFKGLTGEKEQYAYERGQFTNPFRKPGNNAERGIFFGDLPNVADSYGTRRSFFARPQNPMDFDWEGVMGHAGYSSKMSPLIESAWDKGADAIRVRNIEDIGHLGHQTQYVFRDPMALRYTHAKFDPKHVDSPQLLWTGGVPVFAQPVEYDPWEKENESKN